jgi:hypothetical protein
MHIGLYLRLTFEWLQPLLFPIWLKSFLLLKIGIGISHAQAHRSINIGQLPELCRCMRANHDVISRIQGTSELAVSNNWFAWFAVEVS